MKFRTQRRKDTKTRRRKNKGNYFFPLCLCVFVFLCSILNLSCKSAVEVGHNTALDSVDLIQMTDDMAMKLSGDPNVEREIAAHGALKIVVEPVKNELTAEVLPRGPAEAFTGRVRSLLSKHSPDRFIWIMNRDAFYRLRAKELDIDLGPSPDAINPEYALTATFSSLTNEDRKHRSEAYLCVYELTDLAHRTVLWTDKYEVQKSAVKEFLD
jgi:Peptidoglycan-synthase activator LpoB